MDGDTALIGAYATAFGSPLGKTFVFEEGDGGTWEQVTELMPRDPESHTVPETGSTFGWAVAIDDDRAVVGSYLENSLEGQRDGGAAYLFAPCTDDGALSGPVHEGGEPMTDPAQDEVHEANCNVVASNGA